MTGCQIERAATSTLRARADELNALDDISIEQDAELGTIEDELEQRNYVDSDVDPLPTPAWD